MDIDNLFKRFGMWVKREKKYRVTYFAIGLMSNQYRVGEFEFNATSKQIDPYGGASNYGFNKYYHELINHFPRQKQTKMISYASTTTIVG